MQSGLSLWRTKGGHGVGFGRHGLHCTPLTPLHLKTLQQPFATTSHQQTLQLKMN
jgi:hypothetical protein